MSGYKFTDLPAVTTLDDTDIMPAIHLPDGTGGSKKITLANLRTVIIGTSIVIGAAALTDVNRLVSVGAVTGTVKESKVQDGVTTGKVLTLAAPDNYTLTVPATGTVALLATANVFTAIQTIDLGTGSDSAPALTGGIAYLKQADGVAAALIGRSWGTTGMRFIGQQFGGNRAVPTGSTGTIVSLATFGYDGANYITASAGSLAVNTNGTWSNTAGTSTNLGTRLIISVTLLNAISNTNSFFLQGTSGTDPFATVGIGIAPTAGNGLLQLVSGTTKTNGIAFGTDTFAYRSAVGTLTHLGVGGIQVLQAATQDGIILLGRAGGTSSFNVTITTASQTASWTLTIPALTAADTVATLGLANIFTAAQTINLNGSTPSTNWTRGNTAAFLIVSQSAAVTGFFIDSYGQNNGGQGGFACGGSSTSPSPTTSGLVLTQSRAWGWDGTGTTQQSGGRIVVSATELWSSTNHGSLLRFDGVLTGGSTSATQWMWISGTVTTDPSGTVGIGAAPTAGNGLLQLASGTTKASGIAFGTDTFFYRIAAGSLANDFAGASNFSLRNLTNSITAFLGTDTTRGYVGTFTNHNLAILTNNTLAVSIDTSQNCTFAGDITHTDAKNLIFGSTTGTKIGTATTQKIAFYNSTPVVQQNTTGTSTVTSGGVGTALKSDTTSTGGTGSTAYTTADIIKALKAYGLLAA